jgi:hypothetical protein
MKTSRLEKTTLLCTLILIVCYGCSKTEAIPDNDIKSDGNYIPSIFTNKYVNGTGIFADYSYIVPPDASSKQYDNLIKIENNQLDYYSYAIAAFPLEPSSGNLEVDAQYLFSKYTPDYIPFIRSGGTDENISFEKGKTMQGFDYVMVNREVIKTDRSDVRAKSIVVVKVGNKVAALLSDQDVDATNSGEGTWALNFVLFTIRFNNAQPLGITIKKDLLGTWGSVGTSAASSTSYYGTNTFSWGGITEIRTSKDADFDNVYTKTFGGSGSYTLNGNELKQTWKATNKDSHYLVNVIQRKRIDDDSWQTMLWKISIEPEDITCNGLPCLRSFYQPNSLW